MLKDFETLGTKVMAFRGKEAYQRLDTPEKIRSVLKRIFIVNFDPRTGMLKNINPQALLHDLATISNALSFVATMKQLQSGKETVKGFVASIKSAAEDVRRLGEYHPGNPRGFRDVNLNVYTNGKKTEDFDVLSDLTVWELKVGEAGNWHGPEFSKGIDQAVQYARANGMERVGFRLSREAIETRFNSKRFQEILVQKKVQYPDIKGWVVEQIDTPPIP